MKLGAQPIIHPQLMQHIVDRYPSLCAIGEAVVTQDEANQPVVTFVPNVGYRAIPCFVQPSSGAETRQANQVLEINQWIIGLNGYFPSIVATDQATVDSIVYNILRVAHDDMQTTTYLTVERVA